MAMGYVPCNLAESNSELEVEINGNLYKSKVESEALYDPLGKKMRS
jgi:glycine cleavage system aminomethyltransferase T